MNTSNTYEIAKKLRDNLSKVIVGNDETIDFMLTTLFSGGHLLLEDTPGTGKTLLSKSLAKSISGSFKRIQFTADLLPSDITGLNIYHPQDGSFHFVEGPAFTNILLADEINRATPRAQSALLECMEERQITVDGKTMDLQKPFFVIATENPVETIGTYPLPEAQLDRFTMKVSMGFPSIDDEVMILERFRSNNPFDHLEPVTTVGELSAAMDAILEVYIHPLVLDYIAQIIVATRNNSSILLGASPRCSLALMKASMAYAVIKENRDYVTPDDVKKLAVAVISHRLLSTSQIADYQHMKRIMQDIVASVPVPTEDWTRK